MSIWTLAGGPVFGLLALLGCVAVFLFANRLLNLRRAQIDYVDFVRAGEPVCDIEILFGEGKSASLNGGGVR